MTEVSQFNSSGSGGNAAEPKVFIYDNNKRGDNSQLLTAGTDYTVVYMTDAASGNIKVMVYGLAPNYKGVKALNFQLDPEETDPEEKDPRDDNGGSSGSDPAKDTETVTVPGNDIIIDGKAYPVSAKVTFKNNIEYTGGKIDPEEMLGAVVDLSSFYAVTAAAMTGKNEDPANLFKVSWKAKNNKNAGTAQFYPKIKFITPKAKACGITGQPLKDIKTGVTAMNKQFKKNPLTFTIDPADIEKCLESVEGSFTPDGKLKLKKVTVQLNGKSKKLPKKQYRAVDPDPAAGSVTIEGAGKNFTGKKTVKIN